MVLDGLGEAAHDLIILTLGVDGFRVRLTVGPGRGSSVSAASGHTDGGCRLPGSSLCGLGISVSDVALLLLIIAPAVRRFGLVLIL